MKGATAGAVKAEAFEGLGCLGKSDDDEPVFTLVARDQCAAEAVRDWAERAYKAGAPQKKVEEALLIANAMETWRLTHGGGKVPD